MNTSLAERLLTHCEVTNGGCWLSTYEATVNGGYPKVSIGNRRPLVHRVAYELWVGPIPEGLQLDHLCRQPRCFNPVHLEPVTSNENTMRSPVAPAAINARKTHCKRGHLYDEANTYRIHGSRHCRACNRLAVAARKARLKATGWSS